MATIDPLYDRHKHFWRKREVGRIPVKNWSLMLRVVVDAIGPNCVKVFIIFQISLWIAQWKVIWKALLIRFPSIINLSYHSRVYKSILLHKVRHQTINEIFGFTQWLIFSHCDIGTKTAYKLPRCYCCTCVCSYHALCQSYILKSRTTTTLGPTVVVGTPSLSYQVPGTKVPGTWYWLLRSCKKAWQSNFPHCVRRVV